MPTLADQLGAQITQLALRVGVTKIVIAMHDPMVKQDVVVASPGAMMDLRKIIAEKFGLVDLSDPNARPVIVARLGLIDPETAGSDTGWNG